MYEDVVGWIVMCGWIDVCVRVLLISDSGTFLTYILFSF